MRIADDMEHSRAPAACDLRAMLDEQSPDAASPLVGFHEQRVQFGIAVLARQHSGESDDDAVAFGNEHVTVCDLFDRQRDCVGVREQHVAIARVVQRGPPLQVFQIAMIGDPGWPNHDASRHTK